MPAYPVFCRLFLIVALLASAPLRAETCAEPLSSNKVSGAKECLLYRMFGSETPETQIVWLHGDTSNGGPARSHFKPAERFAADHEEKQILSVALIRPGYPDGSGEESSVSFGHGGRKDSYTDSNVREVIAAIERFKQRYQPKRTVLVGHSGGAAVSAIALGMSPTIADAALLVACACDPGAWRWTRSENPMAWADKVSPSVRIVALTGAADTTTPPAMPDRYIELQKQRGLSASHQIIPGADHNAAFRAAELDVALLGLLAAPGEAR